ncbi:hypothetical protein OS965_02315 [Streptomyces sp. H27-G5]|uniref:hypothetical protein n=1 Tax=Streptomyces sp. H27-G5 TaxID=2996698 RepID=UPI00226DD182|nr:hypothetical protein [Streptomyces sp. H27-G5]MCY0917010.1 hypothetical protein [Streptomyces sp. H27-G5]
MNTQAALLLAAADRIDANSVLDSTARVGTSFPRAILAMTARSTMADLRETVASVERGERLAGLRADLYQRTAPGIGAQRDSRRYADSTGQRATQARQQLSTAETSASHGVDSILALVGPIPAGITRGDLAELFRTAAELVS